MGATGVIMAAIMEAMGVIMVGMGDTDTMGIMAGTVIMAIEAITVMVGIEVDGAGVTAGDLDILVGGPWAQLQL
jgi:hypothetical protein